MSCSSLRCRGADGAWAAARGAPLGQPGRYGSGFLVQPVAVRRARALWLVPRARRSAAKPVHCLRVASSAAANRDHRAATKPRTTRRRRPGRLQPSPYRLFGRTRESNPNGVVLESTRSAASPPRRAAARLGAKEAARKLVGATRRPRRGSPRKNRRAPPAPRSHKEPSAKDQQWTSPN